MQSKNCDSNEKEYSLGERAKIIGVILLVALVLFGGAAGFTLYPQYQKQKADEAARVAKVAQEKAEVGYKKSIQAAQFGPRKKRKTKMVQIPAGGSGSVVFTPGSLGEPASCTAVIDNGWDWAWVVMNESEETVLANQRSDGSGFPNGWGVSSDGTVSAPESAPKVVYTAVYATYGECTPDTPPGAGEVSSLTQSAKFEVVEPGDVFPAPRRRRAHVAG